MKVVVLGASGMLGAMVLDVLSKSDFDLVATTRSGEASQHKKRYPEVEFKELDAESFDDAGIKAAVDGADYVVNCIGIIKPYIHDDNAKEVERAVMVNSLFPHRLGRAVGAKAKVIQIATDCVYSGQKGAYVESDQHDALDVYGKSKSVGEAYFDNFMHLRCSIIGPELKSHLSLLDWFLGQDKNAESNGFINHQWNGVTTLHYAKICQGIISENISVSHLQHVVPGNLITKADMLKTFAKEFNRQDIKINDVEAPTVIDRTLATENQELNAKLWKAAGYSKPPTVEEMVAELAAYNFNKEK